MKGPNRPALAILTTLLALTLCPLILMFYTSLKPGGTLGRSVSEMVAARDVWIKPGEIFRLPLGQDMRKFATISFTLDTEGTALDGASGIEGTVGLVDIQGHHTEIPLQVFLNRSATVPVSVFRLSQLNPNVPEKTAEELTLSFQGKQEKVCLRELRLTFRRFTFINYIDVWISGAFGRYLFNSALIAFCIVLGNLLFASMAGYVFARKQFPGKQILFLFILGSLIIPPQVLMVPVFILMKNLNWLNSYWALILPALVNPFNIFLMRQYISQLPTSFEDAARMDGAGDIQIFLKIILPLARPALAVVGINTFMGSWNTFLYPFLLTNTAEMRTLPVGLALYKSLQGVDWVHLMAGSSITAFPVIVVFLLFQRHIITGLTAGSSKG